MLYVTNCIFGNLVSLSCLGLRGVGETSLDSFGAFGSYDVDVRNELRKNIRDDNVAKNVHWDFCKKNGLEHMEM